MTPARIAVVGAGYAGVLAAQRLARRAGPLAQVTLLNPSPDFVERIRLHQGAAGHRLRGRPIRGWLTGTDAQLRIARVVGLDLAGRLRIEEGGVRSWLPVDHAILAAGSATAAPVPGADLHAHRLDSPAQAAALAAAARAAAARAQPLVIVGGGLTALEAATELADAIPGLRVTLVCRGGLGDGALGARAVAHVHAALARRGIEVHAHTAVTAIEPDAVVTARDRLAAGAVLWAAGFVASPLAAAAGLAVDGVGRVLVDDTLAVPGVPWLWAAGDAAMPAARVGAPVHMACKTAMPMGRHAADNLVDVLAGRAPRQFRFGDSGVCVSLGRTDGVIQRRDPTGVARGMIGGRLGAWLKERVCRFTLGALDHPALQATFGLYQRRGQQVLAAGERASAVLPAAGELP